MEKTRAVAPEGSPASKRAAQAKKNREEYPETTALVDQLRKTFGKSVRVLHACESGHTVGIDLDYDTFVMPHMPEKVEAAPRTAAERLSARERAPRHRQHLV